MNVQAVLSSISSDRGLWLAQYHAEVRERDKLSNLEAARKEGRKEGIYDLVNLLKSGFSIESALEKLNIEQ